ncbi:hypothetical protein JCM8208_006046 [Rhodotorula glutinis]
MSSARLLTQLDMPSRPPSSSLAQGESSPSSDDSCPATPSKDKFREWTFPRQPSSLGQPSASSSGSGTAGGGAGASSTASGSPAHAQRMHNLVDGAHGRSSSVTPSKGGAANKGSRAAADSMDLRHRSNASLAQSPSSPLLPRTLLSPARPKEVAKLVYSNVRRKSLNDLTYVVLFAACLVLFARALLGVGYDPRTATPRTSPAAVRAASAEPLASVPAAVVDVQFPEGFLPRAAAPPANPDEYLADVHQAQGDSSHDAGENHFRASPDDPALSDEHVHHAHHSSEDPLWPEDPTHLDREAEAAARPRPRPARLAPQDDAPVPSAAPVPQDDVDAEEARLVELVGAQDEAGEAGEDEVEGEEPDVVYEGEEVPGGDDEQVLVVEEGESEDADDENDEVTDDEAAAAAAVAPGSLHVVDADDDDASPGALSALEELLDSAQEEELAARVKKGGDAEAAQREVLRRAQRGREALARAQAKAAPGAGAGVERRRMVRAKKVRR